MTRVNVIYKDGQEIVHTFKSMEQARKFELSCKARDDVASIKILTNNK
jgi:hypothetical protein